MSDNKIMTAEEKFDEWYNNRLEGNTLVDFAKYYAEYYHEKQMEEKMELERIIEILEKHQEWRRDQNVPPKTEMQSPIEIGWAIDMAIKAMKEKMKDQK